MWIQRAKPVTLQGWKYHSETYISNRVPNNWCSFFSYFFRSYYQGFSCLTAKKLIILCVSSACYSIFHLPCNDIIKLFNSPRTLQYREKMQKHPFEPILVVNNTWLITRPLTLPKTVADNEQTHLGSATSVVHNSSRRHYISSITWVVGSSRY